MTKQEKIKSEYIRLIGIKQYKEIEEFINEDGWCHMMWNISGKPNNHKPLMDFGLKREDYHQNMQHEDGGFWRPIKLDGLEDNNGWIKISSEEDLPTDINYNYFYCQKNVFSNRATSVMDLRATYNFYKDTASEPTHYMKIDKPLNDPLY